MTKIRERANGKGYDIEFDDPKKRAWTPTLYQAEALASCEGDGTWEVIHINEPYSPFLYWASSHPKNGGTWYLQWGEPIRFGDEMGFTITTGIDPGKDEGKWWVWDPTTIPTPKDRTSITLRRGAWEKEFSSSTELVDWVWELMEECNKSGLAEHSARELSDEVVRSLEIIRERDAEIDRLHRVISHLKLSLVTGLCLWFPKATRIFERIPEVLKHPFRFLSEMEQAAFDEWENANFPDEGD
jgi:hypothetical protein